MIIEKRILFALYTENTGRRFFRFHLFRGYQPIDGSATFSMADFLWNHFLPRAFCVGLSGGVSFCTSCRSERLGTLFRLVDSFFKGLGEMLEDSTFWDTSELLNQTPFEDESDAIL